MKDKTDVISRELVLHGEDISMPYIKTLNSAMHKVFHEGLKVMSYSYLLAQVCSSSLTPQVSNFQMNQVHQTNSAREITISSLDSKLFKAIKIKDIQEYLSVEQMDASAPTRNTDDVEEVETGPSAHPKDIVLVDDGHVHNSVQPFSRRVRKLLGSFTNGNGLTEIARVLARPYPVLTSVFATTDGPTTFGPWVFEYAAIQTMMARKLEGVFLWRGDLVLTLECNANPMQQGLYYVAFLHSGGISSTTQQAINWYLQHRFCQVQVSQLPGVFMNLGCDTKVTLRVPWKSAQLAQVNTLAIPGLNSIGSFFIYPFQELASTSGSTTASFTLWAHYENVELGAISTPQMGGGPRRKKIDLLTEEQEDMKPSAALRMASVIANGFAPVPIVGPILQPLSWVLDAAAGLAKSFGYSKPNVIEQPKRVGRSNIPYMAATDGGSVAEPLSMTVGNHVEFGAHEMGSSVDEMSFEFLNSIWSHHLSVNWPTTSTVNTVLFNKLMNPNAFRQTYADGAVNLVVSAPFVYVASHFNLWRGSIEFKVVISKTKFHSGRLLITFAPNSLYAGAVSSPTAVASAYMYRNIVDIRETDEFYFTIPYISERTWCTSSSSDFIGLINIVVLDPLTAPAVVASSIDLTIFIRGGPDLAFAGPDLSVGVVPCVPSAVQMDDGCVKQNIVIGQSKVIDDSLDGKSLTTGETITSFRQIIKRLNPIQSTVIAAQITSSVAFSPSSTFIYTSNGTVLAGTNITVTRDVYTHLNAIYAFSRGGIRIGVLPLGNSGTAAHLVSLIYDHSFAVSFPTFLVTTVISISSFLWNSIGSALVYSQTAGSIFEYFVPQNTQNLHRVNAAEQITTTTPIVFNNTLSQISKVSILQQGASTVPLALMRAGADDSSFGCFVSIPPFFTDASPP